MKKRDMAIDAVLLTASIAFLLNMPEEGYLKFVDVRPIAETQLAKVVEGDATGCLTTPSQTKLVLMSQALALEGKTAKQALNELGTSFCEGKNSTIKYLTTSGKYLYLQLGKSLDEPITYGFNAPEAVSPTSTTKTGRNPAGVSVQLPRKTQGETNPMERR